MADYKVLYSVYGASPDAIRGEVPFSSLSYTQILNDAGNAQITVPMHNIPYDENELDVARTYIWIDRDGVLVWGGIVWTIEAVPSQHSLTLGCGDFLTYLDHRVIDEDTYYSSADQTTDIFLDMNDYFSDGPFNTIIDNVIASGVLRDQQFNASEYKNVGEFIRQLAARNNGFDFRYEVAYSSSGGGFTDIAPRTIYPTPDADDAAEITAGTRIAPVFDTESNCEILNAQIDGNQLANRSIAISGGYGEQARTAEATDTDSQGNYGTFDKVISFFDERSDSNLTDHATRESTRRSAPIIKVGIQLYPNTLPPYGSFNVGDLVELRGTLSDYRDVSGVYRITSETVTVDPAEQIGLLLAPAENF